MITAENIRKFLTYDWPSGDFFWACDRLGNNGGGGVKAGQRAGSTTFYGYIGIKVNYKRYLAHRLVWLWITGKWPSSEIDHIDRDKKNNRWTNLREVTPTQNRNNTPARRTNKLGVKGVFFDRRKQLYNATIRAGGRRVFLGYFPNVETASAAYKDAARKRDLAGKKDGEAE